ncbi:carboxypeptidase regulatory-like domain-containing protein [Dactylosporangium sp. CS-047395]|uniref:carboxypeptidase regulatory-like domain-containing protein n=1 Tax=Dactylosporangium sp. CS-047395 TaxID=3239936 RepID=UPI003D93F115
MLRVSLPKNFSRRPRPAPRLALSAVAVLLATGLAPAGPADAAPAPVTAAETYTAASAAAARSGKPVEVLAERTEISEVYAVPNGTFQYTGHSTPQRVHRADGGWTALDTTLRVNADGTVSPGATMNGLRFSGGGTGPLATMTVDGRAMTLTWPQPLPAPTLSGNIATYAELLPGVDLQLVAEADRFTHVFVIKNATAAKNPALKRLKLRTSFGGLKVARDSGGALAARDDAGHTVFAGAAPTMWDSRGHRNPGIDAREAQVGTELTGADLTLVPDQAMLGDSGTTYPVFVDPQWTGYSSKNSTGWPHWTVLRKSFGDQHNYDKTSGLGTNDATSGVIRSGYSSSSGTVYTDRSLFQLNIYSVLYTHINTATFRINHAWSGAGCTGGAGYFTDLYAVAPFNANTSWNNYNPNGSMTNWHRWLDHNDSVHRYGDSCGPANVDFNVTAQVVDSAAVGDAYLWLGLKGAGENNEKYWRRYQPDADVIVNFNRAPNRPADGLSDAKPCVTGSGAPWVTTTSPFLTAVQSDTDTGQPLTTTFYIRQQGQGRIDDAAHRVAATSTSNGVRVSAVPPTGLLQDGGAYTWDATTNDQIDNGQTSASCDFFVDASPPNNPTATTAATYNNTTPTGGPGIPDTFTFHPPGTKATEVVGYAYSLDGGTIPASGVQVDGVNADTTATVSIAPTHDGATTLRVWTKDRAGRYSAQSADYPFLVKPGGIAAGYTFEGAAPGTDTTGHANALTLSGGTGAIAAGRSDSTAPGGNKALTLSGSTYAETAGTVTTSANGATVAVRTDGNLTISAWVRVTAAGTADQTVVALNGTNTASVLIGYKGAATPAAGRWMFQMAETDVASPALVTAVSDAAPVAGQWTHLTGTYTVTGKQLKLYVNGVAQATTATLTTGFNAAGRLSVGAQQWNGAAHGRAFTGAVDDVRVDNTVVDATTIMSLARPLPAKATLLTATPIAAGTGVQVRFDGGDANVGSFRYSLDSLLISQTGAASGGQFTATFANAAAGTHTVRVKAVAAAGSYPTNASDTVTLTFTVIAGARVTGVVRGVDGNPVSGATVSLQPGGQSATTAADGSYTLTPSAAGHYTLAAVSGSHCGASASTDLDIAGAVTANLALRLNVIDAYGYSCNGRGSGAYAPASTLLGLSGDNAVIPVALPFALPYYGKSITSLWVDTNGVAFTENPGGSRPENAALPSRSGGSGAIAPFWADLQVDAAAGVYTVTAGSAPNRTFTVEWRNVALAADSGQRLSAEAILSENGDIAFRYADLDSPAESGGVAVVGIAAAHGQAGIGYSADEAALASGQSIAFGYPAVAAPLPGVSVSGTVTVAGNPVGRTTVQLDPLGLTTTTDAAGHYRFDALPVGSYHLTAQLCLSAASADVAVSGDTTQDFVLSSGVDSFGYTCTVQSAPFVPADDTVLALTGDDAAQPVDLPFAMPFYGQAPTSLWVSTNGLITLDNPNLVQEYPVNESYPIPSPNGPSGVIAPFWDDLEIDASSSVRTATVGTAPNRRFVVEWRNATMWSDHSARLTAEAILGEDGSISFGYQGLDTALERGAEATVGIADATGSTGSVVSFLQAGLAEGESPSFTYPRDVPLPTGTISGSVTVAGSAPAGGVVVLLDGPNLGDGISTVTDGLGRYHFDNLFPGSYTALARYCGQSGTASPVLANGETATVPLALSAAPAASGSYTCTEAPAAFVPGDTDTGITGDDVFGRISTPFPITLYGQSSSAISVDTDGAIFLADISGYHSGYGVRMPDVAAPNGGIIAPFWDDLIVDEQSSVLTRTIGAAPSRRFVVEWHNVIFWENRTARVSIEVVFDESGAITFNYAGLEGIRESGSMADVGLESVAADQGFDFAWHVPVLRSGRAVTFTPVP